MSSSNPSHVNESPKDISLSMKNSSRRAKQQASATLSLKDAGSSDYNEDLKPKFRSRVSK